MRTARVLNGCTTHQPRIPPPPAVANLAAVERLSTLFGIVSLNFFGEVDKMESVDDSSGRGRRGRVGRGVEKLENEVVRCEKMVLLRCPAGAFIVFMVGGVGSRYKVFFLNLSK